MKKYLSLPVHLEALHVKADSNCAIAGPSYDFSKLPRSGSNTIQPFLANTAAANPFEDTISLQAGLHFHWTFPLALTKTTNFPVVYRQSFYSIFGRKTGDEYWQALLQQKKEGTFLTAIGDRKSLAKVNLSLLDKGPEGFSEAIQKDWYDIHKLLQSATFPPVPDRWLLIRTKEGKPIRSTVIESNYVWPTEQEDIPDTYPYKSTEEGALTTMSEYFTIYPHLPKATDDPPYRYIGRAYDAADYSSDKSNSGEYLEDPLTVVGYGHPAFGALYPNCRSVFGFYDPEPPAEEHYELIGWYDDSQLDVFKCFVDDFKAHWHDVHHEVKGNTGINQQYQQRNYLYLDLMEAVHRQLRIDIPVMLIQGDLEQIKTTAGQTAWQYLLDHQWITAKGQLCPKAYAPGTIIAADFRSQGQALLEALNQAIEQQFPDQLLCYARYDGPEDSNHLPQVAKKDILVAVGNTPTEALSALLAQNLSINNAALLEEQLMAIQFGDRLRDTTVDTGPLLASLRHEKQFTAVKGGTRWRVSTDTKKDQVAGKSAEEEHPILSTGLAQALSQLNELEQKREQCGSAIASLRRQIYADWCAYLEQESELKGLKENNAEDADSNEDPEDTEEVDPEDTEEVGGGDDIEEVNFYEDTEEVDGGDEPKEEEPKSEPEEVNPGNSNEDRIAELEELLEALKKMIGWQIEQQLPALLEQEQALFNAIVDKRQEARLKLKAFDSNRQFLRLNDIENWSAFIPAFQKQAALSGIQPKEVKPEQKVFFLRAINEALLDLDQPLPFPEGAPPSDELSALADAFEDNELSAEEQEGRRLRHHRLTLEAYFPEQIKHRPALILQPQAASRYWRPNDPVVYVTGLDRTPRHQAVKDVLTARLIADLSAVPNPSDANNRDQLHATLHAAYEGVPTNTVSENWHPILLDWQVGLRPPQRKDVEREEGQADIGDDKFYPQDYLQQNYHLGQNDLVYDTDIHHESSKPFHGQAILTDGGGQLLRKTLVRQLVPEMVAQFRQDLELPPGQQADWNQFRKWLSDTVKLAAADLPPEQADPDQPVGPQITTWLEEQLAQQDQADTQLITYLLNHVEADGDQVIVQQFLSDPVISKSYKGQLHFAKNGVSNNALFDAYLTWCQERTHLKAFFAQGKNYDQPLDILLRGDQAVRSEFIRWLKVRLGPAFDRYREELRIPVPEGESEADQERFLEEHYDEVIAWYQPQVAVALHLVVEILAYQVLLSVRGLGQALGGFAQALLMRHQTYQLPVLDPFNEDADFVEKVGAAVLGANQSELLPDQPFSPWRAGALDISRLRLVDSFGRHWPEGEFSNPDHPFLPIAPTTLPLIDVAKGVGAKYRAISLPPRLVQPARIDFRWLTADTDQENMNGDAPAANPICGWVVPNEFDDSLMIYSAAGDALGYIDEGGHWRTFPGNSGPVIPADIDNPELVQMVTWLIKQHKKEEKKNFLAGFLSTLGMAQENMAPEQFAEHDSLALLLGQPLALVRAAVRVQLKGPPAVSLSAGELRITRDYFSKHKDAPDTLSADQGLPRNSWAFEQVQLPLRLGEFHRLNDGLVGYWVETDKGYKDDTFYAPQTTPAKKALAKGILTRHAALAEGQEKSSYLLSLSLQAAEPLRVSMLMDPRMPVHATTGLLPAKALYLPADLCRDALQRLQVAFLTAPLLTPAPGLQLSLPTEAGFRWSWVEQQGQQWSVLSPDDLLHKQQLNVVAGSATDWLWTRLLQQGWLELVKTDLARILAPEERPPAPEKDPLAPYAEAIERLFAQHTIQPFDPKARFDRPTVIREGWLKLSPEE